MMLKEGDSAEILPEVGKNPDYQEKETVTVSRLIGKPINGVQAAMVFWKDDPEIILKRWIKVEEK